MKKLVTKNTTLMRKIETYRADKKDLKNLKEQLEDKDHKLETLNKRWMTEKAKTERLTKIVNQQNKMLEDVKTSLIPVEELKKVKRMLS